MTRVTFGPFHPHLEGRFLDTLFELKEGDPFGRILVITPTRALSKRLLQLLAQRRPLLGVRFDTFLTFAYTIIREAGEPLFPTASRAMLRLLLADAGAQCTDPEGRFSDLFRFEGYSDALVSLYSRMTSHLVDPEKVVVTGDLEQVVLDIYSAYREKKGGLGIYDAEDRVLRALEILIGGDLLEEIPATLLYGFYDLNPLQREITTLLASRGALHIFSPAVPGEPSSAYAEKTTRLFTRLSTEPPTILPPRSPESPGRTMPIPFRRPERDVVVRVVSASGVSGEAQATACRIVEIKENRPELSWRNIGVVMLDTTGAPHHLKAAFDEYSIPASFDRGFPLGTSPLAAACRTLFGLAGERPHRSEMTTLLSSGFFAWPGIDPEGEQWIREHNHLADVIARESGIVHGLEPFRKAWEKAVRGDPPVLPHITHIDEDPQTLHIRQLSARFARETQGVVDRLVDDITSIKHTDSPAAYADAFSRLLGTYIRRDPAQERSFEALSDIIAKMADLSSLRGSMTRGDFISLLFGSMEDETIPDAPHGDGVFVGDLMSIRGLSFDVLIVTGMNGAVFPRNRSDDPLLGETTREMMGLPTFRSLFPEDIFLFSLAVEAAGGELVLFYQRSDDRGRKAIPSIVLDRIMAGDLTGAPVTPEAAPRYPALNPKHARHREKDLRMSAFLEAFRTGAVAPARAVVRSSQILSRGIKTLDGRTLFGPYGIYDGVIGPREELNESVRRLSPGRLETFALCPFRFFMEYVLETGGVEEPELPVDMDRAEIGSAYHRILYRFFSALKREDLLPVTDATIDALEKRLIPIIDDELTRRIGSIPSLVERARREVIAENLLDTINHEAGRESGGTVPRYFEWRFGFLTSGESDDITPPLLLDTPSGPVEITGSVDRIDSDEENHVFTVVDYKTRKTSKTSLTTRIKKGRHLQLPLYLLAARDVLFSGTFTPINASLINLEESAEKKKEERIDLEKFPDIIDAALSHIRLFVEMMRRGVFFPAGVEPGVGCTYCDHRNHCRYESKGVAQIRRNATADSLDLGMVRIEDGDVDD